MKTTLQICLSSGIGSASAETPLSLKQFKNVNNPENDIKPANQGLSHRSTNPKCPLENDLILYAAQSTNVGYSGAQFNRFLNSI